MEYFPSGNIVDFIKKLKNSNIKHINEEIIVKILFQLLILLKSIDIYNYMTSKTIYFDEHFNVKLLNFSILHNLKKFDIKMCDIGSILIQLCTLNTSKLRDEYIVNNNYYSTQFIDLIEVMLNDTNNIKINADKLLCHPVFLMNTFKLDCGMSVNGCIEILDYRRKLENLRKKEAILKAKEKKLEDVEHALISREKKINLYEKEIKSKLVQAELYLRRCKNSKSLVDKYDIDNSAEYEEIECSDIVETSKKINVDKLEKSCFTRTFSERRVKFKGHSPLKEMDFHRGKSIRKSKLFKDQYTESNKFISGEIGSEKLRDISNTHKPACITKEGYKKKPSLFNEKKFKLRMKTDKTWVVYQSRGQMRIKSRHLIS
ncbi:hypothetical protein WA026_014748 [Henosepilachna vigintioctopunctata]|uniref:Uncharacterized protein n=1 Tax=Henosepilachna vigintioctopunctata TaxID=420089 RepID=A0AAW1VH17_9CUCU